MKKRWMALLLALCVLMTEGMLTAAAAYVPQRETPNYKVAFYEFSNYHAMDGTGKRSGYGFEMMEKLSFYLQGTFSYVGYECTAAQCVEMLRQGEVDLYTAAAKTEEREAEFAFSVHPAITATTHLTVKVGNETITAGDYASYEGMRVGMLRSHSYNETFLRWTEQMGFSCAKVYFHTEEALAKALIDGKVDAVVNSYIEVPEDEVVIETFGDTPYYFMARKEDQAVIDALDAAIDRMNVEQPNWRTTLYQKYYGVIEQNTTLTGSEQALLRQMQENGTVVRGVTNPDNNPYSWYADGTAHGIAVELFAETAERLGLAWEVVQAQTREEYQRYISDGGTAVDVWLDINGYYSGEAYKQTGTYLNTTASLLRRVSASGAIEKVAVVGEITVDKLQIIGANWSGAEVIAAKDVETCAKIVLSGEVDGVLLLTYTAQRLVQEDVQNRLRADIVPATTVALSMAVNSNCDRDFCGIWKKTLDSVVEEIGLEVVQSYIESEDSTSMLAALFDNPMLFFAVILTLIVLAAVLLLYWQTKRSNSRFRQIAAEREVALEQAKEATQVKEEFFSKMSHDIRTPLNVVLGMTQVAQKYLHEPQRLQHALESIRSEGDYLLVLVNSILDVNQLEHGYVELAESPFAPAQCVYASVEMLRSLAQGKNQSITVSCEREEQVVIGDANRYSQIIINILSNAIKYTGAGGHIAVTLQCPEEDSSRFICTDDGIGMTEEFVRHITEEYARAEDSRVSKIEGTGLGMAVVKGFVDRMGGTLNIRSKPDCGSTFTVEIPFAHANEEERMRLLHPVQQERQIDFAGKRVLLAEDNALNAEIATELLQSLGMEVERVENGQLAVERLNDSPAGRYSVIFMDLQMPVMDGVSATRAIRASAHPDHAIPIYAMTANTFASDRRKCDEAGMNGYIAKPIRTEEIVSALNGGVTERGGGDANGTGE